MAGPAQTFKAMVSSDWSECLSPSGPFDFIAFNFPQLAPKLEEVFRSYTGNLISLGDACLKISSLLPGPVRADMMDAYLDRSYAVYRGVPELIEWCLRKGILFMLNTTGMIGQPVRHQKFPPGSRQIRLRLLHRAAKTGRDRPDIW